VCQSFYREHDQQYITVSKNIGAWCRRVCDRPSSCREFLGADSKLNLSTDKPILQNNASFFWDC